MNATLTKLPDSEQPWCWSLRIGNVGSDKFHNFLSALKKEIPFEDRRWKPEFKQWFLKDDQVIICLLKSHDFTYNVEGQGQRVEYRQNMSRTEAAKIMYLLPTAPPTVIQAVYRALAKQLHPDTGGSNEGMQQLNRAMEVLKT